MSTQEHLNRIKAKCQELLAIAEKRTAGKWCKSKTCVGIPAVMQDCRAVALMGIRSNGDALDLRNFECNAAFIASCAGAAEAGWRATIAAIEFAESMPGYMWRESLEALIIAAWPRELL